MIGRVTAHPRRAALLALAAALSLQAAASAQMPGRVVADRRAIHHALNRLAFGPRPGLVEHVTQVGLAQWVDAQLQPSRISNGELEARLARLTTLTLDAETIATDYVLPARQERRQRQQAGQTAAPDQDQRMSGDPAAGAPRAGARSGAMSDVMRRERQVFGELAEAKLLRAVYSERQLEEVLVDFWFNHFNVFARKGRTEIYIGEYEREAIRPHVLGRFRDLLGATAKSPAMLIYLDNWLSSDPDAATRMAPGRRPRPGAAQPPAGPIRQARGLNENYARELLELHTLGVDGGYTQQDIVAVARAFTGWTVGRPGEQGFRFAPFMHDRGAKTVLGQALPAGRGLDDGEQVLDIVARHPATARHLAFKLAQRFISDAPPSSVVDRAAAAFQKTDGDLRAVVRVIVTSPEFAAPEAYRAKVKTPFEFVVSALRATSADVQRASSIVRALAGMGMPLYLCQPPTGYDETSQPWVSSGALVTRMNFAVAMAGGALGGVRLASPSAAPVSAGERVVRDGLGGDVSTATLDTIGKARTPAQAVALAIGSPEFQRQ